MAEQLPESPNVIVAFKASGPTFLGLNSARTQGCPAFVPLRQTVNELRETGSDECRNILF
jgi:hypothetical protein